MQLRLDVPEELYELKEVLMHNGYMNLRVINGKMCGLHDYLTTRGICIGLDEYGLERRYCYQNRKEATIAFAEYSDHELHPPGNWIKHKGKYQGQPVDDLNPNWVRS